jgi:hypothetical protein
MKIGKAVTEALKRSGEYGKMRWHNKLQNKAFSESHARRRENLKEELDK